MLRRRSAAYEAPGLVTTKSAEPETLVSRRDVKLDTFLDLRIDMCDRGSPAVVARSSPAAGTGSSRAVRSSSVKAVHIERARAAVVPQPGSALAPHDVQHALRRCQSASTIRKKLQHAVEQSSSQMTHDQLALLRSLAASTSAKQTPKSLLSRQVSASSIDAMPLRHASTGSRPTSAAPLPLHPTLQRSRNQDQFAASAAASLSRGKSGHANGVDAHVRSGTRLVGGFKSNTVQLEVELIERLNEIDRCKLSERAVSRFRACQNALDSIIQQDEHYGRLLARIRDEFTAYVDVVRQGRQDSTAVSAASAHSCYTCGRAQNNQSSSNDVDFETALLQQENAALKKNCAALQREVDVLQDSLAFATTSTASASLKVASEHAARGPEHDPRLSEADNDDNDDDELSAIQLLSDAACREMQQRRPREVPLLDFAALSPYSEETDDDDDNDDLGSGQ